MALHYATENQASEDVVTALIKANPEGACVQDKEHGWLPLHSAAANEASEEVVLTLLRAIQREQV